MSNNSFEDEQNSRGQAFNSPHLSGVSVLNIRRNHEHSSGLATLQKNTLSLMNSQANRWGFEGLPFTVKRQKMTDNLWKLTVENPKTHEILLVAEGHGDKIFEYEDNLAKMALALAEKGLKITSHKT